METGLGGAHSEGCQTNSFYSIASATIEREIWEGGERRDPALLLKRKGKWVRYWVPKAIVPPPSPTRTSSVQKSQGGTKVTTSTTTLIHRREEVCPFVHRRPRQNSPPA